MHPTSSRPTVSVVLATHNRAQLLRRCLKSLVRQSLPADKYEIIIVDNDSSDSTAEVAEHYVENYPNVRCVVERTPGVAAARNRGVLEAQGTIIAFTDDDAVVTQDWLEEAVSAFRDVVPRPHAVGGPIYPLFTDRKPSWVWDGYLVFTWGDQARLLHPGEYFYGGNVFFDADVFELGEGFDSQFGPIGNRRTHGTEQPFFDRLWDDLGEGASFYYSPGIRVFHFSPKSVVSARYRIKRAFANGQTIGMRDLGPFPVDKRFARLPALTFYLLRDTWSALKTMRQAPSSKYWVAHDLYSVALRLGTLCWALGIRTSLKRR